MDKTNFMILLINIAINLNFKIEIEDKNIDKAEVTISWHLDR